MPHLQGLYNKIVDYFAEHIKIAHLAYHELTIQVEASSLLFVCTELHEEPLFAFEQLIDLCGVDYLEYGQSDWQTHKTTETGFSRGRSDLDVAFPNSPFPLEKKRARFAVVYHLLSLTHNHRLRLCVPLCEEDLWVSSVTRIWPSAAWYEREAFDLFGIFFNGHADLRRLLTDYGFVGHPFRKDFPLVGQVEARYDATLKRVIYEPVSIEPRILEPKVIRRDHRYPSIEKSKI